MGKLSVSRHAEVIVDRAARSLGITKKGAVDLLLASSSAEGLVNRKESVFLAVRAACDEKNERMRTYSSVFFFSQVVCDRILAVTREGLRRNGCLPSAKIAVYLNEWKHFYLGLPEELREVLREDDEYIECMKEPGFLLDLNTELEKIRKVTTMERSHRTIRYKLARTPDRVG